FFNIIESGARQWLAAHPADGPLVVIGVGSLGQSLVVAAVQRWAEAHPEERLPITLVDRVASARAPALLNRHPTLHQHPDLAPSDLDLDAPDPAQSARLTAALADPALAAVYVSLGDEALALTSALTVQRARRRSVPVVVRTRIAGGLSSILRDPDDGTALVDG